MHIHTPAPARLWIGWLVVTEEQDNVAPVGDAVPVDLGHARRLVRMFEYTTALIELVGADKFMFAYAAEGSNAPLSQRVKPLVELMYARTWGQHYLAAQNLEHASQVGLARSRRRGSPSGAYKAYCGISCQ